MPFVLSFQTAASSSPSCVPPPSNGSLRVRPTLGPFVKKSFRPVSQSGRTRVSDHRQKAFPLRRDFQTVSSLFPNFPPLSYHFKSEALDHVWFTGPKDSRASLHVLYVGFPAFTSLSPRKQRQRVGANPESSGALRHRQCARGYLIPP